MNQILFVFNLFFSIGCNPVIAECDGEYNYDSRKNVITWSMPILDSSNKTGSMEFSAPNCNPDDFFPLQVNFVSKQSYAHLKVTILWHNLFYFQLPLFPMLLLLFVCFPDYWGDASWWWCSSQVFIRNSAVCWKVWNCLELIVGPYSV